MSWDPQGMGGAAECRGLDMGCRRDPWTRGPAQLPGRYCETSLTLSETKARQGVSGIPGLLSQWVRVLGTIQAAASFVQLGRRTERVGSAQRPRP